MANTIANVFLNFMMHSSVGNYFCGAKACTAKTAGIQISWVVLRIPGSKPGTCILNLEPQGPGPNPGVHTVSINKIEIKVIGIETPVSFRHSNSNTPKQPLRHHL